jgi:integrase
MACYKRDHKGRRVPDNKPGIWCYDFMWEGVRYRKSLRGVETRKQAEAIERAKRFEIQTGAASLKGMEEEMRRLREEIAALKSNKGRSQEIEFEQFVETVYLPHKLKFNPETYCLFKRMAKVFCAHFKGRMMHEITPADVQAFRQKRAEGITNRGGARALATLNRERNQLSGVFSLAVENEIIVANPVHKVRLFPLDNAREKVLEPEEELKLFDALTGKRAKLRPIVLLILNTGLRLREATELKWDQVNLSDNEDRREITIRGKGRGEKKKLRVIPLNDAAFDLLKGLREACNGKGKVFSGRGLSSWAVGYNISKICDEIGLPDVTVHTLRHTFATRLAQRGDVNMEQVRKLMGHSDMKTTQRYSHLNDQALRETVKKLEKSAPESAQS